MIFLTVGNEGFDRLVELVDSWFSHNASNWKRFAQIADGAYVPKNMESSRFLTPTEYRSLFEQSQLIISHAGMGTIITALEMNKSILILPRKASCGETRNEHQLATIDHFQRSSQILVAKTEADFKGVMEKAVKMMTEDQASGDRGRSQWPADASLIDFVSHFVHDPSLPVARHALQAKPESQTEVPELDS